MTSFDLLLRGGKAVLPGQGLTQCDIAVTGETIAAILAPATAVDAARVVDIDSLVVMPGPSRSS